MNTGGRAAVAADEGTVRPSHTQLLLLILLLPLLLRDRKITQETNEERGGNVCSFLKSHMQMQGKAGRDGLSLCLTPFRLFRTWRLILTTVR